MLYSPYMALKRYFRRIWPETLYLPYMNPNAVDAVYVPNAADAGYDPV